nr:MAG TPA: hypothetical protein [Caudoviricetes sp.]
MIRTPLDTATVIWGDMFPIVRVQSRRHAKWVYH